MKLKKILLLILFGFGFLHADEYVCFTHSSINYKTKTPNNQWKDMYAIKIEINDKYIKDGLGTYQLNKVYKNGKRLYVNPNDYRSSIISFKYKGTQILQTFYHNSNIMIERDCGLASELK